MRMIVMVAVFVLLLCEAAFPGVLYGRIIREDGKALARTVIRIEKDSSFVEVKTNGFGGYEVRLPDGKRKLKFVINDEEYTTDSTKIYSPRVKQNWQMVKDKKGNPVKLEKAK